MSEEKKENDANNNNENGEDNDKRPSKRRPFATGSKPGPDEIDHHLESKGFYRKHVARDASSLFRVVAEQVLDVQNYHDKVRQDCASFIEQNLKDYVQEVDKNIYNYCTQLRRNRTHGSLFDLKVMARLYKKNVILYEPTKNFQTTERYFVQQDDYDNDDPLRVFFSEQDKHFDIIFTLDYTEDLADCQGMVYEVLYKDVYKLPDVCYAVERMLHDPEGETTVVLPDDPSKYTNAAGEIIEFDKPEDTNCVLKDPRTCHFHNQEDFEDVIEEQKDLVTVINRSDEPGRLKIYKPVDGFLYDKEKSCVRQLLDERITPFPYKVAKALDRSIYRNTDFELWSENRKDQRIKWLDSNGLPIRDHDDMFSGAPVEKRTIHHKLTIEALSEILGNPSDKRRGYTLDELCELNDGQKQFNVDPTHIYPAQFNNGQYNRKFNNYQGRRRGGGFHQGYGPQRYENSNFHHQQHHQQPQQQHHHHQGQHHNTSFPQELNRENEYYQDQEIQSQPSQQISPPQQTYIENNGYQYVPFDQFSPPPPHPQVFQPQPGGTHYYISQPQPAPGYPMQAFVHPQANFIPNFSVPPPTILQAAPQTQQQHTANESLNLIHENELTPNINRAARESADPHGNDLPLNDLMTLQFYYNLGVRYFSQFGTNVRNRLEGVVNQLESLHSGNQEQNQNRNELGVKVDAPPPAPANTPVSSRPQQGVGSKFVGQNAAVGNRFQGGNNQRRQYVNQNREGGNYHREGNWRDNRNRHGGGGHNNANAGNNTCGRKESVQKPPASLSSSAQTSSSQQQPSQMTSQSTNQTSPSETTGVSPIANGQADSNAQVYDQGGQWQQQQQPLQQQVPVQPFYQYQPAPAYAPPQQAAPVPGMYFCGENGELIPCQPPPPSAQQPPMQQVYYSYPPTPAPVYYPPQQQAPPPPPAQFYDDSGHVEGSMQNFTTAFYYQPPPVYYPPTPASAGHVLASPIYPIAQPMMNPNQQVVMAAPVSPNPPTEDPQSNQHSIEAIAEEAQEQGDQVPVENAKSREDASQQTDEN